MKLKIELEQINNYENKIINFINKYESIVKKITNVISIAAVSFLSIFEKLVIGILDLINMLMKPIRYSTYPLHWIWIKVELKLMRSKEKLTDKPTFKLGAHYFYGKPEAGKSTCVYHHMMDYANYTGKSSYTTAMMETPRKNVYGQLYYYHQLFAPDEFFQDGQQIVAFDTDRHNMIVYEELLGSYHQRNNAKKSYNDEVLPMIASMGAQRHQGIDLFYFISQLPRNDIAIMQMLRGYHEPQIKKQFDYKNWLDTGKFRFRIKGWKITSHEVVPNGGNDYKLVNKHVWFLKNIYDEDFKYFNKLNMKSKYDSLAKHRGVEMK